MKTTRIKQTLAALFSVVCFSTLASAQITDAVYSVNVIGMQKVEAVPPSRGSYTMIGMPFDQIIPNLDNVVGTNGVANNNSLLADQVLIYNPTGNPPGFKIYWLAANRRWVSSTGFATNIYLLPGGGAWYLNRAVTNRQLTFVGDVVMDDAVTNYIVEGLQILSYPFSSPVNLASLTFTNGRANNNSLLADQVMIHNNLVNPPVFDIYWLSSQRRWVSAKGFATNVIINPGQSFWFQSRTNAVQTWVENRPYEL